MSINEELMRSVERATKECGQSASLSQRIVAWLNEMSQRELNKQEHSRHLNNVRAAINTSNLGDDDED